ncbi:nuclear transport factor 2 family protein [Paraburkholderia sediminicola]|uniref:nuclear transport factor 2 family protein n=1 Tax=Paraburkholderia sediminicola TaxID=458836 RepID=UPI0038BA9DC4
MSIEKMPELVEAVDLYFQALHECDLDKFDRVFHTSCSLFDMDDGKLTVVPIADYRRVIAERVSPMSKGQKRDDALISADFLSTDIAVTKVRLRIHDKVFIDHLNWAYVNGSFVIVAKLWHDISTGSA